MKYNTSNINHFWSYLIVEELLRNDLGYFCISPGSRSTPLTVAVADNPNAYAIICHDERGAAFHALGYAKATGKPAILICTSGTAAANYYPAIIEAKQTETPLIIITADRPPELQATGANQTINQTNLYGNNSKWYFELPVPDEQVPPQMVLTTIDHAVYQARQNPAGPVHINCMFREPLEPSELKISSGYLNKIAKWQIPKKNVFPRKTNRDEIIQDFKGQKAWTQNFRAKQQISSADMSDLTNRLNDARSGLLVVGRLSNIAEMNFVQLLAIKLGWPVFADITSGLRSKAQNKYLINFFDQILLKKEILDEYNPDLILHIGAPLTSRRFMQFIINNKFNRYVQISGLNTRQDPAHCITDCYGGNIAEICEQLISKIKPGKIPQAETLYSADSKIRTALTDRYLPADKISEISVAQLIAANLPAGHGLFLGNSMPIRDFEMFSEFNHSPVLIGSNRGASGIDGTLATALGFAAGHNIPLTVVLGDLALLHDLNSFSLINSIAQPVIIIVINNHGGGIFSFLPVSGFTDIFEQYFATPHTIDFKNAAALFEIDYAQPESNQNMVDTYTSAVKNKQSMLIEVITDRVENLDIHKKVQQDIIANL